jgi:HSP20 family protein
MAEQEIAAREKRELEQEKEKTRSGRYYIPNVDIYEENGGLKLWADMPGVTEQNVEVTLNDDVLTITGTVSTVMYEKLAPVYTEYNVGNYFRQFALHEDIDPAGIKARMRNGVLELDLPKREKAKPRKIEVTTG